MSAITVRRLPEGDERRLRLRAASNGRSMEAEARAILLDALRADRRVDLDWVDGLVPLASTARDRPRTDPSDPR